MTNNQNKSLEIVIKNPSSPMKRQSTHYVEMSLFDAFCEDCIDFKNYIRDILDTRYTNVAAENELVSDEKESNFWTTKLATLEERINALSKENEHLKGEIDSYQKVVQLIANETSNKIDNNVWKTVTNKPKN